MEIFPIISSIGFCVTNYLIRPILSGWGHIHSSLIILKPCRFPIAAMIIGAFSLIFVPQGQDLLRGLAENTANLKTPNYLRFFFIISAILWMTYSWYWSRVMLYLKFPDIEASNSKLNAEKQHAIQTLAPRIIGFGAAISITIAFFEASFGYENSEDKAFIMLLKFSAIFLFISFIFLYVIIKRREWSRKAYQASQNVSFLKKRFVGKVIKVLDIPDSKDIIYGAKERIIDLPPGV